jgi:glycosyltransferase involved in cell wall biosynthesis
VKVGIDARSLRSGPAGVSTYVRNLLAHLDCLQAFGVSFPANNFAWNQGWGLVLPLLRGWDLFHAPAYTAPLVSPVPVVVTIHDVSYLAGPEYYPYRLDPMRLLFYRASARRARRVIVPSEFSRSEVLRFFPELADRVRVVPMGVSDDFFPDLDAAAAVRRRYRIEGPYLLHVGDIHRRRNLPLLARVSGELGLQLIAVGRVLEGRPPAPPCRTLQDLPIEDLRGLYSGAEALVYASLYEGFGLPLLEGMACGIPVVAVRRASIPEVCGEAAILVDFSPEALQEGIRKARADRLHWIALGRERAAWFTWRNTAGRTLAVYRELAAG